MSRRPGILVRAGGELGFVPAAVARQVVPLPTLSPVATTPLQMAVVGGQVVPVIAIGSPTRALLVCEIEGEAIGLSGLEMERAGAFDAIEGGVVVGGRTVRDLDVLGALRSLEAALEPRVGEAS
jgi:hypothetical protein